GNFDDEKHRIELIFQPKKQGYKQLLYFCFVKISKALFNFYIQASFHVALSAAALTWLSFIIMDYDVDWLLLGFVFTATITGYNFVLYAGIAKLRHRSPPQYLR